MGKNSKEHGAWREERAKRQGQKTFIDIHINYGIQSYVEDHIIIWELNKLYENRNNNMS